MYCSLKTIEDHQKIRIRHKDKEWENISNADYKGLGVSGFGQRVHIITTTGLQQNKIMY